MRISVVTPTLDSAPFLRTCVASIRMQAMPGLEIEHLVADGGSTDGTVEMAEELGCTIVPVPYGTGIFPATNLATAASTGVLVGYLGSDDVLLPGALAAVAHSHRTSGRRWMTGSYTWVDEHFRPLGRIAAPPRWLTAEMHACLGWCYSFHAATYMERSLFDELGGMPSDYISAGDYQFLTEAMQREPYARIPQTLAAWRRRSASTSIVHPAGPHEGHRVVHQYGPRSALRRQAYRALLKGYVNARNPEWAYRKRRPLPPMPTIDG